MDDVEEKVAALKDYDESVRVAAALSLGNIGDEMGIEPLIHVMKQDDALSVRFNAAAALGKIGDERAVEPLIDALEDEEMLVWSMAAWALGCIGDERAIEPLVALFKEDDPNMISHYEALQKLGHGNIGD